MIDGDNDPANNKFTITVTDDAPAGSAGEYVLNIVEDSITTTPQNTFNTSADANADNTVISVTGGVTLKVIDDGKGGKPYTYPDGHTGAQDFYGSVTVNANGSITYVPNPNYSNHGSPDSFIYTTTNGADESVVTVDVNVKPVSDAPSMDGTDNPYVGTVTLPAVNTLEDTAVTLGLKTPTITDKTDQNTGAGDAPERLGLITLTLTGSQINGVKLTADADGSSAAVNHTYSGPITIWLTDVAHPTDLTMPAGALQMTSAQFESLKLLPVEHRSDNIDVSVKATSHEVDDLGNIAVVDGTPIAGATSEATLKVWVQAVTDDAALTFTDGVTAGTSVDAAGNNMTGYTVAVDSADPRKAIITLDEDTGFKIKDFITAAFADLDGSEQRSITIANPAGSGASVYVFNGTGWVEVQPNTSITIDAKTGQDGQTGTISSFPDIAIGASPDFSGHLNGITITINAQDKDSDGFLGTTGTIPNPAEGVVEGDKTNNSLTIDLIVKPVAGDLDIKDATGNEDTAITFLTDVKVTDASTATGTLGEVITKVSFKLPAEWTPTDSGKTWTNTAGQVWTLTAPTGTYAPAAGKYTVSFEAGEYVITFDANSALTREEREEILGKFTLTPPAHSSKDVTLDIKVTSKDFSVISGGDPSAEVTKPGSLKVTVKPVAESANTNSDGTNGNDVTYNPSYVYTEKGEEDKAFSLGVDGSFKLSNGWSNEDGKWVRTGENWIEDTTSGRSEDTFALLTPYEAKNNEGVLAVNGGVLKALEGSVFTYEGPNGPVTIPFAGEPVKIPMQYLDTVKFTGPKDWSGVVKIKVQAGTIDYDEDDGSATELEVSGESWLTNLIIEPRADQVTLKVDTPVKTLEDTPVKLNIVPTSSDKNETFDVTISGIPKGATIKYWENGTEKTFTANADNSSLSITNFDKSKQPELTLPTDSNEPINLTVKAESVDTLTYIDKDGVSQTVTHRDPSKAQELPINVEVQGVPDKPNVTIVDGKEYWEDGVEDSSAQGAATGLKVALKDLVTSMESGEIKNTDDGSGGLTVDGSETVTLSISDLPKGFTLTGAGPQLGAGDGVERVWVISKADLDKVQIVVLSTTAAL